MGIDGAVRALGVPASWHFYIISLAAMLGPGDEVIVARDLHTSLLTALIHTGARPIYVAPRLHPSFDISLGVSADDVAAVLAAYPAARLVVLTSPSYWGVASDVAGIATVAHARGVPLYVDEAWGRISPSTRSCRVPPWQAVPTWP